MSTPLLLSLTYLIIGVLCQYLLWTVMPNVGMGGLAVFWFIWPGLALSVVGLWAMLKAARSGRMAVFGGMTVCMLLTAIALHPQDDNVSFSQKIHALFQ